MEWSTVSTMKGQKGQIQWFCQWQRSMYQVSQAEIGRDHLESKINFIDQY